MLKSILAAAAIAVATILPASGQERAPAPVYLEIAQTETIGCVDKADLIDVIKSGRLRRDEQIATTEDRLASVMRQKMDGGRCYPIGQGVTAFASPINVDADTLRYGVVMLVDHSGNAFYGNATAWRALQ